jgi:hypothetical protein
VGKPAGVASAPIRLVESGCNSSPRCPTMRSRSPAPDPFSTQLAFPPIRSTRVLGVSNLSGPLSFHGFAKNEKDHIS